MPRKVREKDMMEMEKKLVTCKERLGFLVDFTSFTPREIRMNSEVFKWYNRMDRVFEDHERIVSDKTNQYQEGLKVRSGCLNFGNSSNGLEMKMKNVEFRTLECILWVNNVLYVLNFDAGEIWRSNLFSTAALNAVTNYFSKLISSQLRLVS